MVIFINKSFHQQKLWTFLEVLRFLDHSEESLFPVTCDYFNCIIINYPEDELLVESYLGLSFYHTMCLGHTHFFSEMHDLLCKF